MYCANGNASDSSRTDRVEFSRWSSAVTVDKSMVKVVKRRMPGPYRTCRRLIHLSIDRHAFGQIGQKHPAWLPIYRRRPSGTASNHVPHALAIAQSSVVTHIQPAYSSSSVVLRNPYTVGLLALTPRPTSAWSSLLLFTFYL